MSKHTTTNLHNINMVAQEVEIPKHFLCPLTNQIMKHPVMTKYGQCFERSAVMGFIMQHGGRASHLSGLSTNWQLRAEIRAWRLINGQDDCSSHDEPSSSSSTDLTEQEY